ncbi:MAG TPA: hypothetical protein VHO03_03755 [Ignavibacteriales bacterium]|nr:hypothetical protein [Ignavibacteriales bacterium]
MIWLLAYLFVWIVFIVVAFGTAPMGYEDADGFHYGEPKNGGRP